MLIDKATKHSIFSLPLIFDDILTKDELKGSDFINMYTKDINSITLDNHIFLVFHNPTNSIDAKLTSHHLFVTSYIIKRSNIKYKVYTFQRAFSITNVVNRIDKGLYYNLSYNEKIRILSFWDVNYNSAIHSYLFDRTAKTKKPECEIIT